MRGRWPEWPPSREDLSKITNVALPLDSALANPPKKYDYQDSYSAPVPLSLTATDAAWEFFGGAPAWVSALMRFRNSLASLVGLKTGETRTDRRIELRAGQRVGLFRIFSVTDREVILGEDDRHLDFRVSVFLAPAAKAVQEQSEPRQQLIVSTVVHYRNVFGRIYFFFVRPVHQIIVPAMFRRMLSRYQT